MEEKLLYGGITLIGAGGLLLVLAWMIGVLGHLNLINNYRAHPERYPDGEGLGRWIGWTLAAGGMSFAICGTALITGAIGEKELVVWSVATAVVLVAGASSGLARYCRRR